MNLWQSWFTLKILVHSSIIYYQIDSIEIIISVQCWRGSIMCLPFLASTFDLILDLPLNQIWIIQQRYMYGNPWIGQCFLCFSYIAIFLTASTLNNKQLHTESIEYFSNTCMYVGFRSNLWFWTKKGITYTILSWLHITKWFHIF